MEKIFVSDLKEDILLILQAKNSEEAEHLHHIIKEADLPIRSVVVMDSGKATLIVKPL